MYYSLRTENDSQKEKVQKAIKDLKETFGEDNVKIFEYGMFTTVETKNISGLVDFSTTHSLSLFDSVGENAKKLKIDLDIIDVVYDLDRN